jgi:hypothetical protein
MNKVTKAEALLEKRKKEELLVKAERALIRRGDIRLYREVLFRDIYDKPIKDAWFDELLAKLLLAVVLGDEKRVIISMPPRYGKTEWCVRVFVSFVQGFIKQAKLQYVTYGSDLSIRTSVETKNNMLHPAYKSIFPAVKFDPMQNQKDNWKLTNLGEFYSTSIGGAVTGIGSHFTIIDDPLKAADADSPAELKKVQEFYKSSVVTRLEDDGAIIVIMQRLNENDLAGWLIKEHGVKKSIGKGLVKESVDGLWTVLILPALSDEDILYEYEDFTYKRVANEPLNSNMHTFEQLQALQKDMSKAEFKKQYNQDPSESESGLFKKEDLTYISEFDLPDENLYISVDRAESSKDTADNRAVAVVGLSHDESEVERTTLHDGRHGMWNIYGLCEQIILMAVKFPEAQIWIEEPQDGFVSTVLKRAILIENVKRRAKGLRQITNPVRTYTPPTRETKQYKIGLLLHPVEQHLFKISKGCDSGFYKQFEKELLAFNPMKRHQSDNCIDATSSVYLFGVSKKVTSGSRKTTLKPKTRKLSKVWRGI